MSVRKTIVDQAITFQHPPRIPVWVDGDKLRYSDILTYDLSMAQKENSHLSEWGFRRFKTASGDWGVPSEPFLAEWSQVDAYQAPPTDVVRRLSGIAKAATVCEDRYRIASFGLSGYSIYSALRGADLSAVDFLVETDRFVELMELIFKFECEFFDLLARKGFHAIEFCDDWGERRTSKITLSLWRCLLKHFYAQVFKRAKASGLHIWFSASAQCEEFFADLNEIGVDVVRVETPYAMEIAKTGRQLRGKLCFAVRLDELIENSGGDEQEVVKHLYECLGSENGGFIATVAGTVSDGKIRQISEIVRKLAPKN